MPQQSIAPVHGRLASAVGRWRFPRHYDMRPLMLALTRHEPGGGPNSTAQSHTDMLRGKDILSHFIHACYMCPIGFAYVHVLRRCTTLGRMLACRSPMIACDGILRRILRASLLVGEVALPVNMRSRHIPFNNRRLMITSFCRSVAFSVRAAASVVQAAAKREADSRECHTSKPPTSFLLRGFALLERVVMDVAGGVHHACCAVRTHALP